MGLGTYHFYRQMEKILAAADLVISMGGYNTTMNILTSGVPALVWPFAQNREQRLRAKRLADLGGLRVINDQDFIPGNLARLMRKTLANTGLKKIEIDLNGAANTVTWLENWQKRKSKPVLGLRLYCPATSGECLRTL